MIIRFTTGKSYYPIFIDSYSLKILFGDLVRLSKAHTHTHFQVQGLEKGVSENEAPGPVGAYTTTHNDTITLMPNLIHRISFTESHSQN